MLRELDRGGPALGLQSYGLSETTLEEVFLEVTQRGKEAPAPEPGSQVALNVRGGEGEDDPFLGDLPAADSAEFTGDLRRPTRLTVSPSSGLSRRVCSGIRGGQDICHPIHCGYFCHCMQCACH